MCGIAGILSEFVDKQQIDRMVSALAHRGPDDRGTWLDSSGTVALGHTRLSIIDLSSSGHQPMSYNNQRYWITFNGEIYNYKELQKELANEGCSFATNCDTEVILAAFAIWGVNSLNRLRGMFAFALWDQQERCLYLVRDHLGIKPLLWADTLHGIVFASEIKAILASCMVKPTLDPQSILDLLASGSVVQPNTILKGVHSLEPGTCLIFRSNRSRQTIRYWDIAQAANNLRPNLAKLSYNDLVRMTRAKLEDACRYNLVADVSIGSFLSGGIDSTAITALMARQMTNKVKSFSLGFAYTSEKKDELDTARQVSKHIGCEHTEVILTGQDIFDAFDDIIDTIDQPSYDGTNTYFVSQAASKSVKVALSGLGGDELFAGYPHFSWLWLASKQAAKPLDRALTTTLHRIRPNRWTRHTELLNKTVEQRYASLRRGLSDDVIKSSLSDSLLRYFQPGFVESYMLPLIDKHIDSLSQTSIIECNYYLLNTLLRDADVMSMRHGLEVRPILLDHTLVEFALALPPDTKIRSRRHKAILIDAVKDLLPPFLQSRPKTGFELPLRTWLQTTLHDRVRDCLHSSWTEVLFSKSFLEHELNQLHNTQLLWTLVVFISWAQKYNCILSE